MTILSAETEEYVSGIPLPDFDSLKAALVLFNEGRSRGSRGAAQHFAASDPLTSMMMQVLDRPTSPFVQSLIDAIEKQFEKWPSFSQGFDYGAPNSFFKTTVDVEHLPDGTYLLSLNAAYVGKEPEIGLANELGIERGLYWTRVKVAPDAIQRDDFLIDFDPIAKILAPFSLLTPDLVTGTAIAQTIAAGATSEGVSRGGEFVLTKKAENTIGVSVLIDDFSVGSYYERPYTSQGSLLNGGLRESWEGPMKQPIVTIKIEAERPEGANRYQNVPILDPVVKERVRRLSSEIAAAFNSK